MLKTKVREFNGQRYIMEEAITGDYAFIKAWKGDSEGNLMFKGSARNFNPVMAKAAKCTIAEVEEIVPVGSLDPDQIHLPGVYIHRLIQGEKYEKRIEKLTVALDGNQDKPTNGQASMKREKIVKRAAKEFKVRGCYNSCYYLFYDILIFTASEWHVCKSRDWYAYGSQ